MDLNRRKFLIGCIGTAIMAGQTPRLIMGLLPKAEPKYDPLLDKLFEAYTKVRGQGGRPNELFMHPKTFGKLIKELAPQSRYLNRYAKDSYMPAQAEQWSQVELNFGSPLNVYADLACATNEAILIQRLDGLGHGTASAQLKPGFIHISRNDIGNQEA